MSECQTVASLDSSQDKQWIPDPKEEKPLRKIESLWTDVFALPAWLKRSSICREKLAERKFAEKYQMGLRTG